MFNIFITAVVSFWKLNISLDYLMIILKLFLVMAAAVPVRLCKTNIFPLVVITY